MALTQIIVFAVLQGLSAIVPVSITPHKTLLSAFVGWSGPSGTAALAGTCGVLLAVLVYFWRDLADMAVGVLRAFKGKRDPGARLAAQLIVASIPAIVLGFFAQQYLAEQSFSALWIGWISVGAALLLLFLDHMSMTVKRIDHATYIDALLIALIQVVALIPGVSRAGITIAMGRMLGYERAQAVRFSMLLSIPLLLALIAERAVALYNGPHVAFGRVELLAGGASFLAALIALTMLMSWLKRATFTPVVIYRILVSAAVLVVAYGWIKP